MSAGTAPAGWVALSAAALRAAWSVARQWRLLILWLGCTVLPTTLLVVPLWQALANALDYNLHAAALAQQIDGIAVGDFIIRFMDNAASLGQAATVGMLLTLLLSPLMCAATLAAARSHLLGLPPPSLGALLLSAWQDYGRLLRMLLWATVPLGIAGGLGSGAMKLADLYAEQAILESDADNIRYLVMAISALLFFTAHATVEAGRAQLAAYPQRRSVIKAWWRGCKVVLKKPMACLGLYLGLTVAGLAVAAGLSAFRVALPQLGLAWFAVGLALAQMAVLAAGWMRIARLTALTHVAWQERQALSPMLRPSLP